MHIIFGKENAQALEGKYTIFELDTFNLTEKNTTATAYCVVENISLVDLPNLENFKKLHSELIINYSKQNWTLCIDLMEHLVGGLGGELDTFYQDLHNRIKNLKDQELDDTWSPIIIR